MYRYEFEPTPPAAAGGSIRLSSGAIDQAGWAARKRTLTLSNGLTMAVVELGDPDGPPLLLLHGYTDSSRSWSLTAPFLARYRLLIPDQRGHGASSTPEGCYAISAFADDARRLLDALAIDRVAIAGHSLGSMVAIALAADFPQRVSHLALLGSTALPPVRRGDWLYDSVAQLTAPLDPTAQFLRDWHPANQPTPVDPTFAEAVATEFMAIPLHVWRAVLRELTDVPVARHAPDVTAPILLLSGGSDPLFGPEHHASLLTAFPAAQAHIFPGLGHNFLWEQPAATAEAIDAFLSTAK